MNLTRIKFSEHKLASKLVSQRVRHNGSDNDNQRQSMSDVLWSQSLSSYLWCERLIELMANFSASVWASKEREPIELNKR